MDLIMMSQCMFHLLCVKFEGCVSLGSMVFVTGQSRGEEEEEVQQQQEEEEEEGVLKKN